jgi:hypothetical protein
MGFQEAIKRDKAQGNGRVRALINNPSKPLRNLEISEKLLPRPRTAPASESRPVTSLNHSQKMSMNKENHPLISDALSIELGANIDYLPEQLRMRERMRQKHEAQSDSPMSRLLLEKSHVLAPIKAILAIATFMAFRSPVLSLFLAFMSLGSFSYARHRARLAKWRRDYQQKLEAWVTTRGDVDMRRRLMENQLKLDEILNAAAREHFQAIDNLYRPYEGDVNPVEFKFGIPPSTEDEIMVEAIEKLLPDATFILARVRLKYEKELGNLIVIGVSDRIDTFGSVRRWYYT